MTNTKTQSKAATVAATTRKATTTGRTSAGRMPTVPIYTSTHALLQAAAHKGGMSPARFASLALEYAMGKIEAGEIELAVPVA
jgi:hypothetical protein